MTKRTRTGPAPYDPDGFDAPSAHVALLDDIERTKGLLRAIREVVRPGDVVLDIGSGTGILSVAAAKAGAARVYAIEEGDIAEAASALIAANDTAQVVSMIRGRSTRIELPQRADVLVSEILGADPLDESILEVFRDARQRLLKPEARLIPRALSVYGLPVELPAYFLARNTFSEDNVKRWREAYGFDFAPLGTYGEQITRLPGISPQKASQWHTVARPSLLTEIALDREFEVAATAPASFVAERAAARLGLLVYFDVEMSPSVTLTTSPERTRDTNHWGCCVWCFPGKPSIAAGERVDFEYVHDGARVEVRLSCANSRRTPTSAIACRTSSPRARFLPRLR